MGIEKPSNQPAPAESKDKTDKAPSNNPPAPKTTTQQLDDLKKEVEKK